MNIYEKEKAIIVEQDYKDYYGRFALTREEFEDSYPETYEAFKDKMDVANTDTIKPLVHIWFKEVEIDSDEWNTFFTDMEEGLPDSDIESGNTAYIDGTEFGDMSDLYWQVIPKFFVEGRDRRKVHESAMSRYM